ncbi:putative FAD-linked sulfhydryl oxidase [Scale drop disease virus]|uniref:Sulfhydryl oxidase n=1 Tax=Scale drop disease virus TaxID=1697349 RepID=A0A0K1L6P4_9VIRU|nr:ORF_003L [Scale drop disease virus]AKU37418.1 ORF_003L [Scale drop disease virus]QLI60673.1 putative FAD-linked sulfhydryl oxidase [Scale drop disease virus]QXJ13591.1 ORF003L [Scale drop disease virus]UNH60782.1 putative FAD-linked sulfhydryl oxidase [Scale drop disease virus]
MTYSFDPKSFGPRLWYVLHTAAASAPHTLSPSDRDSWKCILKNLHALIPCITCKNNYKQKLDYIDLEAWLATGDSLFELTVNIHNSVNGHLGKPQFDLERARRTYGRGSVRGVRMDRGYE